MQPQTYSYHQLYPALPSEWKQKTVWMENNINAFLTQHELILTQPDPTKDWIGPTQISSWLNEISTNWLVNESSQYSK